MIANILLGYARLFASHLRHDDRWWLINARTTEKIELDHPAQGEWMAGIDTDDFTFIIDEHPETEPRRCCEMFRYVLTKPRLACDDDAHISDMTHSGHAVGVVDFLARFQSVKGSLRVGDLACWGDLEFIVHMRPQRPISDRIAFNIYDIFNIMSLDAGKKDRSKYIYTMWAAWENQFEALGLDGALRRSAPTSASRVSGDDIWRSCKFPSLSTTALITLLLKFSFVTCKKHGGGLSKSSDQGKAFTLLEALFQLLPRRSWQMKLFTSEVEIQYPSPLQGNGPFVVHVSAGGDMDLASARTALAGRVGVFRDVFALAVEGSCGNIKITWAFCRISWIRVSAPNLATFSFFVNLLWCQHFLCICFDARSFAC